MDYLSHSPDSSNKISSLMNAINVACTELVDAFVMTVEKISEYSMRTAKGVFEGVKLLFVDVIVMKLNQIAILIRELKSIGHIQGLQTSYIQSIIELQKNQIIIKMDRHNFFRENFGRRVNEIFA